MMSRRVVEKNEWWRRDRDGWWRERRVGNSRGCYLTQLINYILRFTLPNQCCEGFVKVAMAAMTPPNGRKHKRLFDTFGFSQHSQTTSSESSTQDKIGDSPFKVSSPPHRLSVFTSIIEIKKRYFTFTNSSSITYKSTKE
jgi:hypothetical protein